MTTMAHSLIENGTIKYIDIGKDVLQLKGTEDEYNLSIQGGTPAILVQQGQYVIPVDGHTVILQEDQGEIEQYIINNVVADEDTQESEENQEVSEQPIYYYSGGYINQSEIYEDEGDSGDENTNTDNGLVSSYVQEVEQENDNSNAESSYFQVTDETGSDNILVATNQQQPQYQYAVLKNGKLHLQTLDVVDAIPYNVENSEQNQQLQEKLEAFQQSITMDEIPTNTATVNLNKITGKNLITGQTVTLDAYFDKLQRRLATSDVTNQCSTYNTKKRRRSTTSQDNQSESKHVNRSSTVASDSFINKKIVVGKTSNGKRIVGRIVRVDVKGKKDESNCTEGEEHQNENVAVTHKDTASSPKILNLSSTSLKLETEEDLTSPVEQNIGSNKLSVLDWNSQQENDPQQSAQPRFIIKKHLVTRENFDYNVGKTLAGLMDLETVQRSLQNKNLVVRLVEKLYDCNKNAFNRTVSYIYGHMELVQYNTETSNSPQWTFVLHNDVNANETEDDETINDNVESQSQKQINPEEINNEATSTGNTSENEEIQEDSNEMQDISLKMEESWSGPFNETTSLAMTITVDKNGKKSTKVNLNPNNSINRCHICKREFKTCNQMYKHLNSVHLAEKLFKCDICNKSFANYTILLRHQKIHTTDGRWYQCPKCSKSFNTAGSLKRHLTVHDPSLRPLECSVCSQRFTDESSLRKHLLIHTGIRAYVCDICNHAFVNQGDLNFHRRIHDPVKQYHCEVCGQEFSRHSNLVRHAEIHRGTGALHCCDICGCSYSFVSSLTRHIVQKHINQQSQ